MPNTKSFYVCHVLSSFFFDFSFYTPTSRHSLALSSIKIQQSFPQLLTHYPCLAQCLQIRRRRVRDPKQLCRSSWGSTYAYVRRCHNLSGSPCLPLRAALAAFIKVEHALMHTHPRPHSHSQPHPHPHPCPCPCACITHSGVDNSNGDKNKHQRHLINAPTRNFNKFFAVLPPLRVFVLSAF